MRFNIFNWFWIRENGKVFSSSKEWEVPADDPDFIEWKRLGGIPSPYPKNAEGQESRDEMNDLLYPYFMRCHPLSQEEMERDREIEKAGCHNRFAKDENRDYWKKKNILN